MLNGYSSLENSCQAPAMIFKVSAVLNKQKHP